MPRQTLIVTVCTGNICRSPLAEFAIADGLREFPWLDVTSAGTSALVGNPMDPGSAAIATAHGYLGVQDHRARAISPELVAEASLLLAMDRSHRSWIVEHFPRAKKKTFTLVECAELAAATSRDELLDEYQFAHTESSGPLAPGLTAIRLSRDRIPAEKLGAYEDIVDPYGRTTEVFEQMSDKLLPATRIVTDFLINVHRIVGAE